MKEIAVTDSFMGLEKDTRKCQNIETYDDCKTRLHVEHLRQECGCLPLSLRLSEKVKFNNLIQISLTFKMLLQDTLCMTKEEVECGQSILSSSCMR